MQLGLRPPLPGEQHGPLEMNNHNGDFIEDNAQPTVNNNLNTVNEPTIALSNDPSTMNENDTDNGSNSPNYPIPNFTTNNNDNANTDAIDVNDNDGDNVDDDDGRGGQAGTAAAEPGTGGKRVAGSPMVWGGGGQPAER